MPNANLDSLVDLIHQAMAMQTAANELIARVATDLRQRIAQQNGGQILHDESACGPIVKLDDLTVYWKGNCRQVGTITLLRLLARLARRPGFFVHRDDLLRDVWDGNIKTHSTVRSAIRRLKRELALADMQVLANSIRCRGGRYGLLFNEEV